MGLISSSWKNSPRFPRWPALCQPPPQNPPRDETHTKNPIKHAPEFFTYKQDYSEPFLSLGIYETVAVSTRVAKEPADIDAQERRAASHLLRKNLTGLYPIGYSS